MQSRGGDRYEDRNLRLFLETLAGGASDGSFLELRHRASEQAFAAQFFDVRDRDGQIEAIQRRAPRTDVYIGCAPRACRAGTRDAIKEVWVLWAECDGADAARAAHRFHPRPPIVIASGSGPNLHAYWPLQRPVPPREAEMANLRLAHALGADTACFDAGRILRPPGTWNHKHRPRRPVAALRLDAGLAFDLEEVVARAPAIDIGRVVHRWQDRSERMVGGDPLLHIPPPTYVETLLGIRPGRNHKVRCPFHEDARPSLHVYPTAARGWNCFSCGRGGSIYDLAAGLWGVGTRGRDFVRLREGLMERFAREVSRARSELSR